MQKWGIFDASLLLNEHGHPPFLFQNWSYHDKYSVDKVWTKIYCHFYFRGTALNTGIAPARLADFQWWKKKKPNAIIFLPSVQSLWSSLAKLFCPQLPFWTCVQAAAFPAFTLSIIKYRNYTRKNTRLWCRLHDVITRYRCSEASHIHPK